MTVTIDGTLGITTPALTATVINADILNLTGQLELSAPLVFKDGLNPDTVSIATGTNTVSWTLTLPTDPGLPNQYLTTDGSGVTSWTTASGTGSVNVGVANQVTYYAASGDTVSGTPNLTINGGDLTVGIAGTTAGSLVLSGATSQTVTLNTAAAAGNWALTLPDTTGMSGEVLSTDGTGITSWIPFPGSVVSGTINQLAYYAATGDAVSGNANATIVNGSLTLGTTAAVDGELTLSGSSSGAVTINTLPAAGTWTLTLPDNNGTNGQVLTTDGNGVTSWTASSGSGTVSNGNTNELAYYSATGIVVSGNTNVRASAGAMTLGVAGSAAGTLTLSGATSGTVTLATNPIAGGWTLTLPATDGANGQALVTDGSGNTTWAAVGGSGTVNTGNATELAYYSSTGNAVVGNTNLRATAGALTLGVGGSVAGSLILSGATSGTITINTPAVAGLWTLTLPNNDGSSGQVLSTDGSGVTSWYTIPDASLVVNTTTISGGTSGRVLYDNAGTVGEIATTGSGSAVLATSPAVATPTITGLRETQTNLGTGAVTIDCSLGNVFATTLSANITSITFSNVPASGTAYAFTLSVTISGSFTITWPASVLWPNNTAPTLSSTVGRVDTFVLYTFDAGTSWYAFTAGQNA